MRCTFAKRPGGFLEPIGEETEQYLAGIAVGDGVSMELKKARNLPFHNKTLKLIRIAFDAWEPKEGARIDGIIPAKDFENFRKKILILAGHCDAVYDLDGKVTFEARSISFANCEEIDFQLIYKRILDVVWERVLQHANYPSQEELDAAVNQLLSFS